MIPARRMFAITLAAVMAACCALPPRALAEHYPIRRFSPEYVRLAHEARQAGLPFETSAGLTAERARAIHEARSLTTA
jgi:hypothetical protein